ncbi:ABC transporter ATP-binding protein [Schauerella aestuarii]|uniref:ABC transporter ATP-binding protein n=1 Tax=Schauerella aestuarii TaxID=2511204 RepID=UPI0013683D0E|nr:ABC transporter ATP-binding protein [Achromobacter aestuarii]MYZ45489.1 ABC transporter ATP-binding protein [Achromobacter aestuarii]
MLEICQLTKSYLTPSGRKYIFKNLNFSVPPDKNVALIGRNGAGKSTLMRLIGGADRADYGTITTDKSISWPVGLSGGFQGSLSGSENVKFVCRVNGCNRQAIRDKVEYVREFSELGDWFQEPVKTYSSGMRSRLAFGLSMAFDFDYFLIDEVMSVGDAQFKEKCSAVFNDKLRKSKIILVTHSMSDVRKFCDLVVLIQDGTATTFIDVEEGIRAYKA